MRSRSDNLGGGVIPVQTGEAMAEPVHIVVHVPKCAGTSIETHLHRYLGDGFWSAPKRSRRIPLEVLGRKYQASPPAPPSSIRAVSGHFIGASVEKLFPDRPIHRWILLRDPKHLVLSWYNYRMMRYQAAGKSPYAFAIHLHSMPADPVAHFLLERWFELPWWQMARLQPREKTAMLDKMLGGFDRVGDIRDCDALIAQISRSLGIPETAERRNTSAAWQQRVTWEPVRYEDLSRADRLALEERTRLDDYLWRRWALRETASVSPSEIAPFLRTQLRRPFYEIRRKTQRARPLTGAAQQAG
jgi:hypothetical protein